VFDDHAFNNIRDVLATIDRFFQLFIEIFPLNHFHGIASFVKQTAHGALIDVVALILKPKKFNQALGVALNDPDVVKRFADLGYDVVPPDRRSAQYFDKFYKDEVALWAKVLGGLGVGAK